jgi:hypothetical protein
MILSNLNAVINDLDGKPVMNGALPLTFRSAMVAALAYERPSGQGQPEVSGEDRFKRWNVASKIQNADEVAELKAEELAMVKAQVGQAFLMVVVGPVWNLIEQATSGE